MSTTFSTGKVPGCIVTTSLARRFDTIVIEDLNVSGMAKNESRAGAILDCGLNEIRRQPQYMAAMRGGHDLRSVLPVNANLSRARKGARKCISKDLSQCGAEYERDANVAINLQRSGLLEAELM
jgi:putative transposase